MYVTNLFIFTLQMPKAKSSTFTVGSPRETFQVQSCSTGCRCYGRV